jgi:NAD(P)H dehydrogenase (quinone)
MAGIPARYGKFPAQWKVFWDATGGIWQTGGLWGKYCGAFVGSGGQGGGQESTFLVAMSTFVHHGLIYVPLGYKTSLPLLGDVQEVRGGSPWGAGVIAGTVGKEPSPTEKELELANIQGEAFWNALAKVKFEE